MGVDRRAGTSPLGASVEELAAAPAKQKRTTTTKPVPVTMDGHEGLYLELTTAARFDDQMCGQDGMLIWEAGSGDGRVLDQPAADRYWLIDVDGRRVVISAMAPEPPPARPSSSSPGWPRRSPS